MPNHYAQVEAGLKLVKQGDRRRGEEILRAVVARGGPAEAVNLAERLVEYRDSTLLPVLKELRGKHPEGWVGAAVAEAELSLADLAGRRELPERLAAERQMGNAYRAVDQAVERWKSGDREGATAALRAVDARAGDAAVAYLVERLQDLREPRLMAFLDELARRRGDTWLGQRAREAIQALSAPQ